MYRYWSSLTWALHSIWSITWYCFGVLRISLYFVELHWSSYLSGRFQQVVIDGATSDEFDIDFGLPQGSCIGLSLFSIYASQLFDIVTQHLPTVHCYADDTKLYLAFRPGARASQDSALAAMEACIRDVREWMINDKLKINDVKSEFIFIGTQAQLKKVDSDNLVVGDSCISPVQTQLETRVPGLMPTLQWARMLQKNCKTGFFYLHNISKIKKILNLRNHGEFNTCVRYEKSKPMNRHYTNWQIAWQILLSFVFCTLIKHAVLTNESGRYIRTLLQKSL